MAHKTVLFCLIVLVGFAIIETKIYKRCELARELVDKYKFERTYLSHWICLVEHESGYDTAKVNHYPPSVSGSLYRSYGLFQINNQTYCSNYSHGGACHIRCEDLIRGPDISKSVACAKKMYKDKGFKAWYKWTEKCKPKKPEELPSLADCFRPQKRSYEIEDMIENDDYEINLSNLFD